MKDRRSFAPLMAAACLALCAPGLTRAAPNGAPPAAASPLSQRNAEVALPAAPDFAAHVMSQTPVVVSLIAIGARIDPGDARRAFGLDEDDGDGDDPDAAATPETAAPRAPQRIARSLASGFIIDRDGTVLTSAHAVAGAETISVMLADRRQFPARLIGLDRLSDVAVLKIVAPTMPVLAVARLGDPQRVSVGEWVAAVGAPFGLERSVTAGIVSAIPRYFPELPGIPMIQTDVAINRGSSGGPLFNLRGEVVGMSALIFSEDGGYAGVSFALPVDVAMQVADELRAHGHVARSRLGARVQEVTPDLAAAFGLAQSAGALITRIEPDGPAQAAGLRGGDIVLGIGARRDMSSAEIQQAVSAADPRRPLELAVWRAGAMLRIVTRVAPAPLEPVGTFVAPHDESREPRLGLRLVEIGPAERRVLGVDVGVRVGETGGAAQRAGILPHDLILAINEVPISKIADFDAVLARRAADRPAALLVKRGASLSYVAVQPNVVAPRAGR